MNPSYRKPLEQPYPEDLDKEVAARVFGYVVGEGYYYRDPVSGHEMRIRKYSTDMTCAFDVLQQMNALGFSYETRRAAGDSDFFIQMTNSRTKRVAVFSSSELPRGICLAALAALKA